MFGENWLSVGCYSSNTLKETPNESSKVLRKKVLRGAWIQLNGWLEVGLAQREGRRQDFGNMTGTRAKTPKTTSILLVELEENAHHARAHRSVARQGMTQEHIARHFRTGAMTQIMIS